MLALNKIKKRKKQPWLILLAVVLAAALLGGGYYAYYKWTTRDQTQTPNTSPINYGPPTQAEKDQGDQAKIDRIQKSEQPPATTGTAAISSISQDAAKNVIVQTRIQATAPTTCTLTLTQQSHTITKTAQVLFQSDFSTCAGFSIPASEFPSTGTWTATLVVTNNDNSHTTSATTQVNIK